MEAKQRRRGEGSAGVGFAAGEPGDADDVDAQRKGDASRLLAIYEARLRSNLVYALRQLVPLEAARRIATGLGSLIDGFYLRAALKDFGMSRSDAVAMTLEYLELTLAKEMSS